MAVIDFRRRSDDESVTVEADHGTYTPLMGNLVTALIVIMLAGLVLSGALFYLRWRRHRLAAMRMQANIEANAAFQSSPTSEMSQNASLRAPQRPSHHRRNKSLTTPPQSPIFVVGGYDEKDSLMDEKRWEAGSDRKDSVPTIHLTFPEELDEKTGKRESKVVVVTVTEQGGVGLQPFQDDAPPSYRERDEAALKSLDLERIGGLKEHKN